MGALRLKLGAAKQLADSALSKKQQQELMDDYEEWCIQVKGWPREKKHKIPMKYLMPYIKKVYTKGGVGSWQKKKED